MIADAKELAEKVGIVPGFEKDTTVRRRRTKEKFLIKGKMKL